MKNFLAKHYDRYYIQTADGQSIETTRAECIALGESPTHENPCKQRWFYDAENYSYIIRLPRNEQSETLYRLNESYVKREERHLARKFACVLKGRGGCDDDCEYCQRKRYPRIVELDKPMPSDGENDDEPQYFEIAVTDEYFLGEDYEEKETLNTTLLTAIMRLSVQQQWLVKAIFFEGKSISEIAKEQRVGKSAIANRLSKIYKKIKKLL